MFNGKCVRSWHGRLGSAFEDTQAVETQSIDIKHLWRFTFYIYRYWLILTKPGTSHELYGVLNHWRFDCLLIILIRLRAKKASALCITGPLWGTTCTGWFPHKANNEENVSMSWRHHVRHFSWRCNDTSIVFVMIGSDYGRDDFVYAASQWETTLHCNVVSHWLGAYTKCSLQWPVSYSSSRQYLPLLAFNDTNIFLQENALDHLRLVAMFFPRWVNTQNGCHLYLQIYSLQQKICISTMWINFKSNLSVTLTCLMSGRTVQIN